MLNNLLFLFRIYFYLKCKYKNLVCKQTLNIRRFKEPTRKYVKLILEKCRASEQTDKIALPQFQYINYCTCKRRLLTIL